MTDPHPVSSCRRRLSATGAALAATAAMLVGSFAFAPPARADVTSVSGNAFGVSITPPGGVDSLNPQPAISFSNPSDGPGPFTVGPASVISPSTGNPPGSFFNAQGMTVRTSQVGTLGTHAGGSRASADIDRAAYLLDVVVATSVHTECMSTGAGSEASMTIGSVAFTDKADSMFKTFTNYSPPPNTTFQIFEGGTVVFNEQTPTGNNQTTAVAITAVHIQRSGLDIYVGRSNCTATGPDVVGPPAVYCDLQIVKTMSPVPLVEGQTATITVTLTNAGSGPCQRPTEWKDAPPFSLNLKGSTRPVTTDAGWSCASDFGEHHQPEVGCTHSAPLAAGSTATFTFPARVGARGSVTNCATVVNRDDVISGNDKSCATVPVVPG